MAGDFGKIGEARIEVKVDSKGVGAGVANAKAKAQRAASGGVGMGAGGGSLRASLGQIGALGTALLGGGVAQRFEQMGRSLFNVVDLLLGGQRAAQDFNDALDPTINAEKLRKLEEALRKIQAPLSTGEELRSYFEDFRDLVQENTQKALERLMMLPQGTFTNNIPTAREAITKDLERQIKDTRDALTQQKVTARENAKRSRETEALIRALNDLTAVQRQQVGQFNTGQTGSPGGVTAIMAEVNARAGRQTPKVGGFQGYVWTGSRWRPR